MLGLGTAGLTDQAEVSRAVEAAIASGYRMIGKRGQIIIEIANLLLRHS